MTSDSLPASRLIASVVSETESGTAIQVQRIVLTPEGRRGLTVGGGVLPDGNITLAIPQAERPFCDGPAVLDYYDGPLLMVLKSPLWGDLLALALPEEEGPWPFLLAPISDQQARAVTTRIFDEAQGIPVPGGRGIREHFTSASAVYILRDYGAQDLVATPVPHPLHEDWLPAPGY